MLILVLASLCWAGGGDDCVWAVRVFCMDHCCPWPKMTQTVNIATIIFLGIGRFSEVNLTGNSDADWRRKVAFSQLVRKCWGRTGGMERYPEYTLLSSPCNTFSP